MAGAAPAAQARIARRQTDAGSSPATAGRAAERQALLRAGRAAGGHLGRTTRGLGISRSTLWRKMQQHGITHDDFW